MFSELHNGDFVNYTACALYLMTSYITRFSCLLTPWMFNVADSWSVGYILSPRCSVR